MNVRPTTMIDEMVAFLKNEFAINVMDDAFGDADGDDLPF